MCSICSPSRTIGSVQRCTTTRCLQLTIAFHKSSGNENEQKRILQMSCYVLNPKVLSLQMLKGPGSLFFEVIPHRLSLLIINSVMLKRSNSVCHTWEMIWRNLVINRGKYKSADQACTQTKVNDYIHKKIKYTSSFFSVGSLWVGGSAVVSHFVEVKTSSCEISPGLVKTGVSILENINSLGQLPPNGCLLESVCVCVCVCAGNNEDAVVCLCCCTYVTYGEKQRFVQHVLIVLSWALLSPRPCPPDASDTHSELTSHCVLHLFFFPLSLSFSPLYCHIFSSPPVLYVIFSSSSSLLSSPPSSLPSIHSSVLNLHSCHCRPLPSSSSFPPLFLLLLLPPSPPPLPGPRPPLH